MSSAPIVHLVSRDRETGDALTSLLAESAITVRTHPDVESLLEEAPLGALDRACLLIDERATDGGAASLVKALRARHVGAPIIVLAKAAERAARRAALAAGATDVLDPAVLHAYLLQRLAQICPGSVDLEGLRPARATLADGTLVTYRLIGPGDAEREQAFVRGLSDASRWMRFFSGLRELPPSMLQEFTNPSYPQTYAVIATVEEDGEDGEPRERQIGVARYAATSEPDAAEFAVVVADDWHGRGIATKLMRLLTTAAAMAGFATLEGLVLRENHGMLELCRKLGFAHAGDSGDPSVVRVEKELRLESDDA